MAEEKGWLANPRSGPLALDCSSRARITSSHVTASTSRRHSRIVVAAIGSPLDERYAPCKLLPTIRVPPGFFRRDHQNSYHAFSKLVGATFSGLSGGAELPRAIRVPGRESLCLRGAEIGRRANLAGFLLSERQDWYAYWWVHGLRRDMRTRPRGPSGASH